MVRDRNGGDRRDMTTLDSSLDGFSGSLLRPDDEGYDDARRIWNGGIDRRPAFIARCRTTADVAAAVRFGVRHGLQIAVRGGGHSIPGHSTSEGGLVVDLSLMKGIAVHPRGAMATVQPGVLWRDLDAATQQHGLAVPGGEVSDTGVAGLTLGGGIGWLSRAFGLTCDSLVAGELVTADGAIVSFSEESDPELLWGLRGGGGNFGVVTQFEFRLHPVPVPMFAGFVMHPLDRAAEPLAAFVELASGAPEDLGLNAALVVAPSAPFIPEPVRGRPVAVLAAGWTGDHSEGAELLRRLRGVGHPVLDTFGRCRTRRCNRWSTTHFRPGSPPTPDPSGWGHSTRPASKPCWRPHRNRPRRCRRCSCGSWVVRSPRSRRTLRPSRFRDPAAMLTVAAMWRDPADPGEPHRAWCRAQWQALRPWSAGGSYVNHLGDEGTERIRAAYGDDTWQRLVALKRCWDPENVFRLNQNIPPAG
jgi:FAD/FMN-containing dehydrogenase